MPHITPIILSSPGANEPLRRGLRRGASIICSTGSPSRKLIGTAPISLAFSNRSGIMSTT